MLDHLKTDKILFLDIETVPASSEFGQLAPVYQELWSKKSEFLKKTTETPAELYQRAGIYAEFGKIICISTGRLDIKKGNREFKIRSFYGDDEKAVLSEFIQFLTSIENKGVVLCGHNGKEFDFPYLARRIIIQDLILPAILDVAGKKPWETPFLDTMELWKFGDYKSFTSLKLLTAVLGIPTPKDDIDGSDIWWVYWREKDMKRIVTYCQKDTLAVAQLILRFKNEPLLQPNEITGV